MQCKYINTLFITICKITMFKILIRIKFICTTRVNKIYKNNSACKDVMKTLCASPGRCFLIFCLNLIGGGWAVGWRDERREKNASLSLILSRGGILFKNARSGVNNESEGEREWDRRRAPERFFNRAKVVAQFWASAWLTHPLPCRDLLSKYQYAK